MMCLNRAATAACLSLPLCSLAQAQLPTQWSFELQCRSTLEATIPGYNLPFPSSLSSQYVTIDEAGGVAIRAFLSGEEGIFYGVGGKGGIIVTGNGGGDPFWSPTIDARNGMIAIEQGSFSDGAYLYANDGTLLRTFNAGGSEGVSGFSGVTLSADGALCYKGDFGFVSDKVVIDEYSGDTRTQTLITDTNTDYSFLLSPEMNDARQVLVNTIPTSGPSRRIVRFEPGGGAPTTVAETGGAWSSFVNSTALAQNGDVAFSARRSAGSVWEVNRWDGTSVTAIADGDNPDIDNGSLANFPPVLNSGGTVAFRATDIAHDSTALWVGDGTDLVKLVEYDQVIDTDLGPIALGFDFGGDTGRQVMNGVVDINDAGQVAFAAFLRNGTIGVFVATPVTDACVADFNGDGDLNFFDVSAFVGAFNSDDPSADLTDDGQLNFFDVSAFISAFSAGCP